MPSDRLALLKAATSGESKFFLGTDSAPHPLTAKKGGPEGVSGKCSAGVFTQPFATQFVLEAFEGAVEKKLIPKEAVREEILRGFLGEFGRAFYGVDKSNEKIVVNAGKDTVRDLTIGATAADKKADSVVTFRSGKPVYSLQWL